MAAANTEQRKQPRKKKSKSRTQVQVSSSESENETPPPRSSKKSIPERIVPRNEPEDADVSMTDASSTTSSASPAPASVKARAPQKDPEEFSALYLRKVTVELADDLDKVRDAQDFKASSLPMLVHALRQGASIYSTEEKRRVVNAAG